MDNQIFSPGRFSHIAKKKLTEEWRQLLLSLLALLGVMVLAGICASSRAYYDGIAPHWFSQRSFEFELILFTLILFVSGTYVASVSFSRMSTPAGALSTLMVPASQFEKFMLRWLVAVPLFMLVFFCIAVVADWCRVWYAAVHYGLETRAMPWFDAIFHTKDVGNGYFNSDSGPFMASIFVMVQSFFLLGSIVWPKRSMLKTFVTGGLVTLAYIWFGAWIVSISESEGQFWVGPHIAWIYDADDAYCVMECVMLLVALFNYWLAFRRFRESEIINRW